MSCDIFLSYTSIKNKYATVSVFRERLEVEVRKKTGNTNLTVFQDERDIHGGDKWEEILESELRTAKLLLVLLSPTWLESEWCKREYQIFRDFSPSSKERPIIPVMWDETSDSDADSPEEKKILTELKRYQIIDWTDLQYDDWATSEARRAGGKFAMDIKKKLAEYDRA